MKLIDLLNVMNEYVYVRVFCNNEELGEYDGRNSIDDALNDREIVKIDVKPHIDYRHARLWIYVKEE